MILRDENKVPEAPLLREKQKSQESAPSRLFFHDWIIPIIVFVQMLMCAFAWTFAGCMMHKTIPLPDSAATWVQNNPSDVIVIVTLISTLLGLISSSLLGRVVQSALIYRLSYAPLQLDTMIEYTKLAQRSLSFSFDRRHLLWTLVSLGWVGLMSFLITAWSSLLAPESVVLYYHLQGNEANFLNPSASNLFSNALPGSQPVSGFSLTPETFPLAGLFSSIDITTSLTDAGFLSASAQNPSNNNPTNFISIYGSPYVSNISTGGIYPTANLSAPPSPAFLRRGDSNSSFQGISRSYSATQHGFTANITCRSPTSTDPAINSNLTNSVLIHASDSLTWTVDTYSWVGDCSPQVEYFTEGVSVASSTSPGSRDPTQDDNGLLMTSVCFSQSFTGPSNQSFLVLFDSPSNSSYSSFTPKICEITPMVTTVKATYDTTGIINVAQPPLDQQPLPNSNSTNSTGVLMWLPALTIWTSFVKSQTLTANLMGDRLTDPTFSTQDPNFVIENYLRGMMEYLGSFMAQSVSNVRSPRTTVPFSGTIDVRTAGWAFHPRTHGPALAAITLVSLLTVAAGVLTIMQISREDGGGGGGVGGARKRWRLQTVPTRSSFHAFDPTETMDVLLASSVGDLARALSESERDGRDARLRVVLGATEDGRPTLRTVSTAAATDDDDMERDASLSSRGDVRSGADDGWSSADAAHHDGSMELGHLHLRAVGRSGAT